MITGNSDIRLTLSERALGGSCCVCRREVLHRHAMHPHLRLRPLSGAGSVKLGWKGGILIPPTCPGHSISAPSHLGGHLPKNKLSGQWYSHILPCLGALASESGPHTAWAFLASSSVLNKSQRKIIVC